VFLSCHRHVVHEAEIALARITGFIISYRDYHQLRKCWSLQYFLYRFPRWAYGYTFNQHATRHITSFASKHPSLCFELDVVLWKRKVS